jgi:hypothetical protein
MSQNNNERIWKINGLGLELDLEDADIFEKVMKSFEQLDEDAKSLEKVGSIPGFIRGYCNIHYKFYDRVFGDGTGERIFGGKKNTRICDEVYDNFLGFMQAAVKKANARRFEMSNKYAPNRGKGKGKKNLKSYNGAKR